MPQERVLVVMDGDVSHDWCSLFAGCTLSDGSSLRVVQTQWVDCAATVYKGSSGCMLMTAPVRESSLGISKPQYITVKPDFVLVRNSPRGAIPSTDERNVLFALMTANVPSINSLQSIYMCLERPIMFAALCEIEKRLGKDAFPLIDQIYYSEYNQIVISPEFPCVMKVGHAHGGYGKIMVSDTSQFQDVASVLALNRNYCTAEEFIDVDYGLRIQKIGDHIRVMKKVYTRSGWKTQYGGSFMEDIPLTPKYKMWAEECSKCLGGLDIFALDALHGVNGKDYIIELNDSMMGLAPDHWLEDSTRLRNLVVDRMDAIYVAQDIPRPVFQKREEEGIDSKPSREYRGERPEITRRRAPQRDSTPVATDEPVLNRAKYARRRGRWHKVLIVVIFLVMLMLLNWSGVLDKKRK